MAVEHQDRQEVLPYKELLFTAAEVDHRIGEMADEVVDKYPKSPLFIAMMRGGLPFASKLMFAIAEKHPDYHPQMDYMMVSTYGHNREPAPPRIVLDLSPETRVSGVNIVLVDDLIDGGHTLSYVHTVLRHRGPASIGSVVLATKDKSEPALYRADIVGFPDLPDEWLTGIGMDNQAIAREANRWMGGIAIANSLPE